MCLMINRLLPERKTLRKEWTRMRAAGEGLTHPSKSARRRRRRVSTSAAARGGRRERSVNTVGTLIYIIYQNIIYYITRILD
jgi:hypothetical protein